MPKAVTITGKRVIIIATELRRHLSVGNHSWTPVAHSPIALRLELLVPLRSGLAIRAMAAIWIATAMEWDVNKACRAVRYRPINFLAQI